MAGGALIGAGKVKRATNSEATVIYPRWSVYYLGAPPSNN